MLRPIFFFQYCRQTLDKIFDGRKNIERGNQKYFEMQFYMRMRLIRQWRRIFCWQKAVGRSVFITDNHQNHICSLFSNKNASETYTNRNRKKMYACTGQARLSILSPNLSCHFWSFLNALKIMFNCINLVIYYLSLNYYLLYCIRFSAGKIFA